MSATNKFSLSVALILISWFMRKGNQYSSSLKKFINIDYQYITQ